jgi:hypothetical protein
MSFDPTLPVNGSEIRAAELRGQFNALHDETGSILGDVTVGTIPKKTGDGTLGDSAISEDAGNVIVAGGKLLSLRRSDGPDAVLLEVHNGAEVVFHLRITADGSKVVFSSNRPGFSFQTPLDVSGAPVAMRPVSVGPFMGTISDPPTQLEVQAVVGWVEMLRSAL